MGLGKTLTILAYLKMCKDKREEVALEKQKKKHDKYEEDEEEIGCGKNIYKKKTLSNRVETKRLKTLIVVPASLLHQWQNEIDSKFAPKTFKSFMYHDANRRKYSYNLDDNDIVFTTYEIVSREIEIGKDGEMRPTDSPLATIKWRRIILDEAHRIKNHNTKANKVIVYLFIARYI